MRSATSLVNFCGAEELADLVLVVDLARRRVALGDLHRDAADDARDLALERANARLARVEVDDDVDAPRR